MIILEDEIECSRTDFVGDFTEDSLWIWIHGGIQSVVEMLAVVYGEVAGVVTVGELLVATRDKRNCKQYG